MGYPENATLKKRGIIPYVDLSISAGGSSNETDITVQFKDSAGNNVEEPFLFNFWMANNEDGDSISDASTSALSDGGSGDLVGSVDDDATCLFLTNASGEGVITVTDSSKNADYACVQDPRTGITNVSRVLATADYT